MGSFFNKALQFLSKNWKRIVTSLGTLAAGLFLGKPREARSRERVFEAPKSNQEARSQTHSA